MGEKEEEKEEEEKKGGDINPKREGPVFTQQV